MATRKWRDVRAEANLDPDKVEKAVQQLLDESRVAQQASEPCPAVEKDQGDDRR